MRILHNRVVGQTKAAMVSTLAVAALIQLGLLARLLLTSTPFLISQVLVKIIFIAQQVSWGVLPRRVRFLALLKTMVRPAGKRYTVLATMILIYNNNRVDWYIIFGETMHYQIHLVLALILLLRIFLICFGVQQVAHKAK